LAANPGGTRGSSLPTTAGSPSAIHKLVGCRLGLGVLEHLLLLHGAPDPVSAAKCLDVLELLFTGVFRFAGERGSD
jgi:hypothetical protein